MSFRETSKTRVLLIDGAMGTMLQESGLKPGACPEEMNASAPEAVKAVHAKYIEAGADIVTTNTFGGTRAKLAEYGLADRLVELNAAAVRIAREATREAGRPVFVAGGMGPLGRFLQPVGEATFDEAYENFAEQARALADAGADMILVETLSDIKEAKAAVIAAKSTGLPVAVTMTFQQDLRTLLGTPPDVAIAVLEAAGADFIGANCSLGPEGLYEAAKVMSALAKVPLVFQPNAGLPRLEFGKTVYPASPEELASFAEKFVALGAGMLGSCCGSTPAHTKAIGERIKKSQNGFPIEAFGNDERGRACGNDGRGMDSRQRHSGMTEGGARPTILASRTRAVSLGAGTMPIIIGERINPTGRKDLSAELAEGKMSIVRRDAKGQAEAGAMLIDINVGLPGAVESELMPKVLRAVEESADLPVVIDSTDPAAIEAALKECSGKPLVNSVTGDADRLETILPLVKKYGAAVVGLTIDADGVPKTAERRVEIAKRILDACISHGIPKEDLVIDALVLTASAEQDQAVETLKAVGMIRDELGLATSLGVSNISFGLPDRPLVNAAYLTMALGHGLDAAMVNPYDQRMTDALAASAVLMGRDARSENYIGSYKKRKASKEAALGGTVKATSGASGGLTVIPIGDRLKQAVIDGDREGITPLIETALSTGMAPLAISNDCLVPALNEVGRLYEAKEFFLPQVMQSAETMKAAFVRLKAEMKPGEGGDAGTIVLATVFGDVHDIGKNILSTLLENHGLRVIDLGKNVPRDTILDEAQKHGADVIGLSALMTTTMTQMAEVIKERDRRGMKTPVIVGGAVITEAYAKSIGAAGASRDAMEAVRIIKGLIGAKG